MVRDTERPGGVLPSPDHSPTPMRLQKSDGRQARSRSRWLSLTSTKHRQKAEVIVRRDLHSLNRLETPRSIPTARATIRAFSSWQLGLPDSSSTMKRSPVPERAASPVCVQPSALRLSLIAAPKSRADLNIVNLHSLTYRTGSFPKNHGNASRSVSLTLDRARSSCSGTSFGLSPTGSKVFSSSHGPTVSSSLPDKLIHRPLLSYSCFTSEKLLTSMIFSHKKSK